MNEPQRPEPSQIWDDQRVQEVLTSLSQAIRVGYEAFARQRPQTPLALVGIRTGGAHLAKRMQKTLSADLGQDVPMGVLDITLYRDDMMTGQATRIPFLRGTDIPFDVEGMYVVLVDDVLFTGRTVRSALDALTDFGRPTQIKLAVLVDRGFRELPIQPDFCGASFESQLNEQIKLHLKEEGHTGDGLWSIRKVKAANGSDA
ncbi:MAG: bifunctional pyr operon transcriptional regulator/uracil phosphoribosyltransferase [Myxococcales bacterium]|nr:bifunctional pyr operon transcriptional regulator/uracil phosphoribosyltransferase [Myxococcales bacterium]